MSVESTTTIAGLNALWPQGTDVKAEGDDHIRLIKSVLKAEFPTGSAGTVVATAQTRSRIVNGAMQVSQENGLTAGATNGYYPADQWTCSYTMGGVINVGSVATVPITSKRIRLEVTTADTSIAAGDFLRLEQRIEGIRVADFLWGTAAARQVVLRFGFRGPAGTYCASLKNGAADRSYRAEFTIPAGSAGVDTVQTIVIPGDTTGTWAADTSIGAILTICVMAGTTFHGTPSAWQAGNLFATASISNGMAATGVFHLFDVGLYLDPLATGVAPAWQMPDEAQELAACQRYWQPVYASTGGYISAGVGSSFPYSLAPQMRVSPAATTTGTPTNTNVTGTAWFAPAAYSARLTASGVAAGGFISAAFGNMNARM